MSSVHPRRSAGTSVLTPLNDESDAPSAWMRIIRAACRTLQKPAGARHRHAIAFLPEQRTSSECDRQCDGRLARSAAAVFDLELRGARTDRLRLPADGGKLSMTRVQAEERGRRDGEHSWSLP